MRKSFLVICALCLALGAKAQKVVEDDVNRTAPTTTDTSHGTDSEVNYMNSSIDFDYYAVDGGWGLAMDYVFNYFMLTGSMRYGETNSTVTDNNAWSIGVGGHYRYWLGKRIYLEGNAGIEYVHATLKYKLYEGQKSNTMFSGTSFEKTYYTDSYTTEEESEGDVALFITPRIGIRLFKLLGSDIAITAGYRWEFVKFKFDKENTNDNFTIGIAAVF